MIHQHPRKPHWAGGPFMEAQTRTLHQMAALITEPSKYTVHPPLYRYSFGTVREIDHKHNDRFKVGPKGVQVAVFNAYLKKWEFGISNGVNFAGVTLDKLDPEFKVHLMLLGVA